MIALGIPSTPGGDHPRGALPQLSWTGEAASSYLYKHSPTGNNALLLLASAGPLTSHHFCLLKVFILILNCFCLTVKATTEDFSNDLVIRGRMDTYTPNFVLSQRSPFTNSSRWKGNALHNFVGSRTIYSNSGSLSHYDFYTWHKNSENKFFTSVPQSKYLKVHKENIPSHLRHFSYKNDESYSELYLQPSWRKLSKRKSCELCSKYFRKMERQNKSIVENNHKSSHSKKDFSVKGRNNDKELPHEDRQINFPLTSKRNHTVTTNLLLLPGNWKTRNRRSTRVSLGTNPINFQLKRRPWDGNLQQPLLHRPLQESRMMDEEGIGTDFRMAKKMRRKHVERKVALNTSGKRTVTLHHLLGNSDFNRPEWTTPIPREGRGDGEDKQDGIPQLEGNKGVRGSVSPFPKRLTAESLPISDTWQRILFARIHGDEKWRRIADPSLEGARISKYLFQSTERQINDAVSKGSKIAKRKEGFRNAPQGDAEAWRLSNAQTKLTSEFAESLVVGREGEKRVKELGREALGGAVHVVERKGKTVFLREDNSNEEEQRRSFKKRRQKRKIEMLDVTVVEGGLSALPCDLKVEDPKDSVQLILWIKEGIHTPLYSYDYRELLGGRPREIRPDANSTLSRRTTFRTDRSPAALIIERTDAEDAGIYRCRVDFLLSPTINRRVNLTVIVPPSELRVSWHLGNSGLMEVHNREAGPFLENSQPSLVCFSDDGWPPPSLSWYEGEELLDKTFSYNALKGQVENELLLPVLTRDDLGRRLTCQASNSNKTIPTTITVNIVMTLSIISVEVEPLGVVWAGEMTDVECHVWGSRPSPSVVWWLGPQMIPTTQSIVLDEGNETISVLNFVPSPRDDGNMLICQATNEKLPDQAVQDSILLSVNYAPVVEVRLGRSLNPDRIKEGDDVYFECTVKSKPPVLSVSWKHNGRPLLSGSSEQILVSNMSLVVQGVTRDHAGNYTCHATNVRNTSASAPLRLDVKYAPVCAIGDKVQYSVAKLENAEIACKVHANPSDVTFKWTFNNTAEAIDVPEGRFVVVKTESRVNYTPMNELDYGTLLCWANNTIGIQEHPCVFHITAAGKPDPPHNCRVFDVTVSSLQIACLSGDDGGLPQNFSLKVYQVGKLDPIVKVSRLTPSFSISGLRPATAYKITIVATNNKGASKLTELKAYTITVPETPEETNAEPARDQSQMTRVPVAVAVGIAVALVPVLVLLVGVLVRTRCCGACKRRSRRSPESESPEKASHSKDGVSTVSAEEINPDIISHTPDPPAWEGNQEANISTIIPTTDLLPNGGSTSYTVAVSTSNSNAAKPSGSRVIEPKQQPVCMGHHHHHHHHVHDTTCLNTSLHAHTCLTGAAAAMPQVPYYTSIQQQQVVEAGVPPPESFSLGCAAGGQSIQSALPTSFNPLVSTLGRKRPQLCNSQVTCSHSGNVPLKYIQKGGQGPQQALFPHLYQQRPSGVCNSCGHAKPVQEGNRCPLTRMQSFPAPSPAMGGQPHHGSQCSLYHKQSFHGQTPLPVISGASDVEFVLPRCGSKKYCASGRTPSVVLTPPIQRQIKTEDGRKHERSPKKTMADPSSSPASSSPGKSTKESTV